MGFENIEIGVKVRQGDLDEMKKRLSELPSFISNDWKGLAKTIGQDPGASSFLSDAFKERLGRSSQRIEELSGVGAKQGFFTASQRREMEREVSEYEKLSERYWRTRQQHAKQGVDRINQEINRITDRLEGSKDPDERRTLTRDLLAKLGEQESLSKGGGQKRAEEDIARQRGEFRARMEEMRDEAALVPTQQDAPHARPDSMPGILGQFGRGMLGVAAQGYLGYYLASRLKGKFHEELARGQTVSDLAQRMQQPGMSYSQFREEGNALNPAYTPDESTRFLSIYGGLTGSRGLLSQRSQNLTGGQITTGPLQQGRAEEAAGLSRLFGFSPEQGASMFGQAGRMGMTSGEGGQKRFATMLAEAVKQGGIAGREPEVFEALLRLGEAATTQGLTPNYGGMLGMMSSLSSSGNPALQGEYGANIIGGMDAAVKGTQILPRMDLLTPVAMSMLKPGERLSSLQAKLQQGVNNPEFFRELVQKGMNQFGGDEDMKSMFAQSLNIPLNVKDQVLKLIQEKPNFTAKDLTDIVGNRSGQPEDETKKGQAKIDREIAEITRKLIPAYGEFLTVITNSIDLLKAANAAQTKILVAMGVPVPIAQGVSNALTTATGAAGAYGAYRLGQRLLFGGAGKAAGAAAGAAGGWQSLGGAAAGLGWGSWLATMGAGTASGVLGDLMFPSSAGGPGDMLSPSQLGHGVGTGFSIEGLNPTIEKMAKRYGLDPAYIRAVINKESGYKNLISSKGAVGLMQVMPSTAKKSREELLDPETNIDAGTKYLSEMLTMFHGDSPKALAAYNAGPGTVLNAQHMERIKGGSWKDYLPKDRPGGINDVAGYAESVVASYDKTKGQGQALTAVKISPLEIVVKNEKGEVMQRYYTEPKAIPEQAMTSPLLP